MLCGSEDNWHHVICLPADFQGEAWLEARSQLFESLQAFERFCAVYFRKSDPRYPRNAANAIGNGRRKGSPTMGRGMRIRMIGAIRINQKGMSGS
jgi:hypothetical protein